MAEKRKGDLGDREVYVISVAAEITGMHAQTLRTYDRMGLVSPERTSGGGRRYSRENIRQLMEIQRLSHDEGVNLAGIKAIIDGDQYATVFKDTRELAKVTVGMVDAMMAGKEPEVNDTKTYDNGVKVVPSYLLEPVSVTAANWKQVLVDSGYYTEDQLK